MAQEANVLFVWLFSLKLLCTANNQLLCSVNQNVLDMLTAHIWSHDRVAVVTCKGYLDTQSRLLLRKLPWAATLWTRPSKAFTQYLGANMNAGLKTKALSLNPTENDLKCLRGCPTRPVDFSLLDCLFVQLRADGKGEKGYACVLNTRAWACNNSGIHSGSGYIASPFPPQLSNYFSNINIRECELLPEKQDIRESRQSRLRNKVIYVGCAKTTKGMFGCKRGYAEVIFNLISFYNVSVVWVLFKNQDILSHSITNGRADIAGNVLALKSNMVRFYDVHQVLLQENDVFYIEKGLPALVSFVNVLIESRLGLCLSLVTMGCALLGLALTDLMKGQQFELNSIAKYFLFLLASFYATSIPITRVKNSHLARTVVYSVWLIAILPLSSYLRSELVSRLSVRSHGKVMDTLSEIDDAVSRGAITPCLRIGTMMHRSVVANQSFTKLQQKLSKAFYSAKDRESLESEDAAQCLACAQQMGHVCFTDSLPLCLRQRMKSKFVESKDTLNPVLIGLAARKNFALLKDFRQFIGRIRETSLYHMIVMCESEPADGDTQNVSLQSDQMGELSRFFVVFALCLASSFGIFMLELFIGNMP